MNLVDTQNSSTQGHWALCTDSRTHNTAAHIMDQGLGAACGRATRYMMPIPGSNTGYGGLIRHTHQAHRRDFQHYIRACDDCMDIYDQMDPDLPWAQTEPE